MPPWVEIARDNLLAAKRVCRAQPRSATSRAYYASHVLLTDALTKAGYVPEPPCETAPHKAQADLVGTYLASGGPMFVTDLSSAISRLYKRRLDADYAQFAQVGPAQAKEAVKDASEIFALLKIEVSS